eukprot:2998334-Pleurochrysis_carterae.AAC.2
MKRRKRYGDGKAKPRKRLDESASTSLPLDEDLTNLALRLISAWQGRGHPSRSVAVRTCKSGRARISCIARAERVAAVALDSNSRAVAAAAAAAAAMRALSPSAAALSAALSTAACSAANLHRHAQHALADAALQIN